MLRKADLCLKQFVCCCSRHHNREFPRSNGMLFCRRRCLLIRGTAIVGDRVNDFLTSLETNGPSSQKWIMSSLSSSSCIFSSLPPGDLKFPLYSIFHKLSSLLGLNLYNILHTCGARLTLAFKAQIWPDFLLQPDHHDLYFFSE